MFARVTKFRMKAERIEAARAELTRARREIMALPGVKRFISVVAEDGSGYAISMVDTRDLSPPNVARVQAIWARFADHIEEAPTTESFAVLADWRN